MKLRLFVCLFFVHLSVLLSVRPHLSCTYGKFHAMDTVAPNARQSDEDAHSNNTDNATSAFSSLQPSLPQHSHFDFGQEIDCPSLSVTESLIPNKMADDDFYHLLQGFNIQQREFLYHVLHCVKTQKTPFHLFLSGGAGLGKTHLVKGIFQALL